MGRMVLQQIGTAAIQGTCYLNFIASVAVPYVCHEHSLQPLSKLAARW
jgi:hypothetical protein